MNILKAPTPLHDTRLTPSPEAHPLRFISNGYAELIEKAQHNCHKIKFDVCVYSISVETFNQWKIEITKILGRKIISSIEAEIISLTNGGKFEFNQYMDLYSLLVFEFSQNGSFNIEKYKNQSMISIDLNQTNLETKNPILESIYKLESSMVCYQITPIVSNLTAEHKAYVPITYFEFSNHKIVSFASYIGPITMVSETQPKRTTLEQIPRDIVLENF